MKRMIIISLCVLYFSLFFVLSPSKTNAEPSVDFWIESIDPNWESEVFHTLPFPTAAISFDSEDNLYVSDLMNNWGPGIRNIFRFASPEYDEPSIYLSYETAYEGINGMDFDRKENLFVSEFMGKDPPGFDVGAIRKIYARTHQVSEPIEFIFPDGDFRPTGIAVTGFGTIYFPGRKHSVPEWGNIYKIESFENYDPITGPTVYKEDAIRTAIAIDEWENMYAGISYYSALDFERNSIYTINPYTKEVVKIATFNQYVEELAFDSNGNLHALEGAEGDPSTIIKLMPPYISIDGCDTGIIDWSLPDGSTISEIIESCEDMAFDHGQFVSCVVNHIIELKNDGLISSRQMSAIVSCAAQTDIP